MPGRTDGRCHAMSEDLGECSGSQGHCRLRAFTCADTPAHPQYTAVFMSIGLSPYFAT